MLGLGLRQTHRAAHAAAGCPCASAGACRRCLGCCVRRGASRKRQLRRSRRARPNIWRFSILRAMNRPLHRARTPWQCHARFACRIGLREPGGKALQGLQGAGQRPACATDPARSGCCWRTRAAHSWARAIASGSSPCCARNWAQLLRLGFAVHFVSRRRAEPTRPAWCQGLAPRLRPVRERLARAALPRSEARRLAPATGRRRHATITPGIAAVLEGATQPHGGVAPRIPAREEIRLIGVEAPGPESRDDVCAPHRWRGGDRAAPCADSARPAAPWPGPSSPGGARARPADAAPAGGPAAAPRAAVQGGGERGRAPARRSPHRAATRAADASSHCRRRGRDRACCTPGPALPADSGADESGPRPGEQWGPLGVHPRHRLVDRSRAIPSTPGCARSHCATVSAVRSGSRATGWRRSRSISTVPYGWRCRRAKSATPSTVGVGRDGTGSRRRRRSRVLRLPTRAHWWPRGTPAAPPRATPSATKR